MKTRAALIVAEAVALFGPIVAVWLYGLVIVTVGITDGKTEVVPLAAVVLGSLGMIGFVLLVRAAITKSSLWYRTLASGLASLSFVGLYVVGGPVGLFDRVVFLALPALCAGHMLFLAWRISRTKTRWSVDA